METQSDKRYTPLDVDVTLAGMTPIFGLNALGFFASREAMACCRTSSVSVLLAQSIQLQRSSQYPPRRKHSQYSFRHLDLLQLHGALVRACADITFTETPDGALGADCNGSVTEQDTPT